LHHPYPFSLLSLSLSYPDSTVPRLGFGTAGLGASTYDSVRYALTKGFRLIDTAAATEWYREDEVGRSIASLKDEIPREQIFLVTKIHPRDHGFQKTLDATAKSLKNLGTDYIDLLLLHYPECFGDLCEEDSERGTYLDAWRALELLYTEGKVKAIGVSNFEAPLLSSLLAEAKIAPHSVQNWM